MFTVVPEIPAALPADGPSLIDRLVRDGARQMLAAALQAEVAAYIGQFAGVRDEEGRRLVVRNGYHEPRVVPASAGAVEVTAPRVNDMRTDPATGKRMRFSSALLPPWARKTPQISEVLPLLYLHGLSTGDFVPALAQFPGSSAGLSAPVVAKLTETWKDDAAAFMNRDLSGADYVYLWVGGIHLGIRLGEGKLCLLAASGQPRPLTRITLPVTRTGIPADHGQDRATDLPGWSCGSDSRRPLQHPRPVFCV